MKMNDDDLIEELKVFLNNKTYIWVKTIDRFYNGYVIKINSNFFIIKDDVLDKIPVFFKDIKKIQPSIKK